MVMVKNYFDWDKGVLSGSEKDSRKDLEARLKVMIRKRGLVVKHFSDYIDNRVEKRLNGEDKERFPEKGSLEELVEKIIQLKFQERQENKKKGKI